MFNVKKTKRYIPLLATLCLVLFCLHAATSKAHAQYVVAIGDTIRDVAIDESGYIYILGDTISGNIPIKNPIQSVKHGDVGVATNADMFIAKLTPDGSELVFSTYLGGTEHDWGVDIEVDADGMIYVLGGTLSDDFPFIDGDPSGDLENILYMKLSSDGQNVVYGDYLGGDNKDYGLAIIVKSNGNLLMTGHTRSTDFPISAPMSGDTEAFVAEIDSMGNVINGTYLGGSEHDLGLDIVTDTDENVYIMGLTNSHDFPLMNAWQDSLNTRNDLFITKFNSALDTLLYSTYLGGSDIELGAAMAIDNAGNLHITGATSSPDFPLVSSIYGQSTSQYTPFLLKFSTDTSDLLFSSYLENNQVPSRGYHNHTDVAIGTNGLTYLSGEFPAPVIDTETAEVAFAYGVPNLSAGISLALSPNNEIVMVGSTQSVHLPTTPNTVQPTRAGGLDGFITKFSPDGDTLVFGTYFGGGPFAPYPADPTDVTTSEFGEADSQNWLLLGVLLFGGVVLLGSARVIHQRAFSTWGKRV